MLIYKWWFGDKGVVNLKVFRKNSTKYWQCQYETMCISVSVCVSAVEYWKSAFSVVFCRTVLRGIKLTFLKSWSWTVITFKCLSEGLYLGILCVPRLGLYQQKSSEITFWKTSNKVECWVQIFLKLPVYIDFEMFWSFPDPRSWWFNTYLSISTNLGHLICFPPNKVLFFIIVSGSTILLNHVTKTLEKFYWQFISKDSIYIWTNPNVYSSD